MRHFPRLNRVAYGILRRRHPTVLTLLEQNDRWLLRRDPGRRAPPVVYCASVSPNVRCVSAIVRQTPLPSQIMCVGNGPLLRVGPFIIARRYNYRACE